MTRIQLRNVVGAAQAAPGTTLPPAVGVPQPPAPAEGASFNPSALADNVRNLRASLSDGRGLVRELVGLKDDLEALGILRPGMFTGQQAPPAPSNQQSMPAPAPAGNPVVDPGLAAMMAGTPTSAPAPQSAPAPAPPDGQAAAQGPGPAPPDTEVQKALREECRQLVPKLSREKILETILGMGTVLLEGNGLTEASDILVDYEVELTTFLNSIPLDRLHKLIQQVAVDKRPAGDLVKVKAMLRRAVSDDSTPPKDDEKKGGEA